MSMITEQVKRLRELADDVADGLNSYVNSYDLREAADTIETLSAKVRAENNVSQPCEDAISRQAVIDALTKTSGIRGDALKALYDLPSVTPQPKWTPVSEELPKKNMRCLVSVGRYYLTQIAIYSDLMGTIDHKIFYQGDYGHRSFEDITQYVKAWMPLPAPYVPQESEDNE